MRPLDDVAQRRREALDVEVGRPRIVVEDLHRQVGRPLAFERLVTGGELVEHRAEREDVAAEVERLALHLLGRHVRDLALDDADLGAPLLGHRLGDAEVEDLADAVEADDDVRRRDVAVHEAERLVAPVGGAVRVLEPLGDVGRDAHGDGERDAPAALRLGLLDLLQVDAVHVLHGEEVVAFGRWSPRSKICTMFGCDSRAAMRASSRNMLTNC